MVRELSDNSNSFDLIIISKVYTCKRIVFWFDCTTIYVRVQNIGRVK